MVEVNYAAACTSEECGWRKDGMNGLALAAQHHDRTGHPTRTTKSQVILYGEVR